MSSCNVHSATINGAAEQLLVRGRDGEYHAGESVPRDQMASFVTNLLREMESGSVAPLVRDEPAEDGEGGGGGAATRTGSADTGLAVTAALVLPGAALLGRRRHRRR